MSRFNRSATRWTAFLFVAALAACAHNSSADDADFDPRPDPIPVHVKNENYLDMNVYVVASGVPRRLGTVSGNSSADYTINWAIANGQPITITATPIGGRGTASTGSLNVPMGMMVDFRIAPILRQSGVSVHER